MSPEEYEVEAAKKHKLWPGFERYLEDEGGAVDTELDHPDDWWDLWQCFVSGAIFQMNLNSE